MNVVKIAAKGADHTCCDFHAACGSASRGGRSRMATR